MALDESFPQEVAETEPVAALPVVAAAEVASDPIIDTNAVAYDQLGAEQPDIADLPADDTDLPADDQQEDAGEVQAAAPAATPAFNEGEWLKAQLGDDAPESAVALKARMDSYKANQLTDSQRGQLALLDPANKEKFAQYAALAGRDYEKMPAAEAMRERFVMDHPDMDEDLADFEFSRQFAQKYPTLHAALNDPEGYSADDPSVLIEKKSADYAARADRVALKAKQEESVQQFYADALTANASTAPQSTPEEIADARDVLKWSDATFKDGATLPIDLGNGLVVQMPIGDPASFKEGFVDTDSLYRSHVIGKDGKINREMQAEIALFLRDPKAYRTYIANAVKGNAAPAMPLADLTNSSRRQAARAAGSAPVAADANQPAYVIADDWQNSNA